ncbi:hypothetical protein ACFO1B_46425 [Dactylosporangium siamense]|nr:hypothetical protein [Dactylosporangium siamense]
MNPSRDAFRARPGVDPLTGASVDGAVTLGPLGVAVTGARP